jgi:hypothetical protein
VATHTFASLDLAKAKRLADLTGIQHDLESAKELATRLVEQWGSEKYDSVLLDALSVAVLVRYSRAFVTGVRERLSCEELSLLSEEQRTKHDRLRAWRDKHIAHSVNAFEENQPVARFCLERVKEEGVYGIECNHGRVIALSQIESEFVIELAEVFLNYVKGEIAEEKRKLLVIARGIPIDDLLAPDRQRAMLVSGESIEKQRKKIF